MGRLQEMIVIAAVFMALSGTTAAQKIDDSFVSALAALHGEKGAAIGRAQRATAAQATSVFCQKYSRMIPSLSPREQDWLTNEMRDRPAAAFKSAEFARKQAGDLLDSCLMTTKAIIENKEPRREALFWAFLARDIGNSTLSLYVGDLNRRGQIEISKDELDTLELAPAISRSILNGILVPALGLVEGWSQIP